MKNRIIANYVSSAKVCGTNISLGTEEWMEFCRKNKVFRFKPEQTSRVMLIQEILVRNRNGAYWYAYRKVNNKQRCIYIGKTPDVCWEKLQETAEIMSLGEVEYYQNRKLNCRRGNGVQKSKVDHRQSIQNQTP